MVRPALYLSLTVASVLTNIPNQLQYPIQNIDALFAQESVIQMDIENEKTEKTEKTKKTEKAEITDGICIAGFNEENLVNYNINTVESVEINKTYYAKANVNFRNKDNVESDVISVLSYGDSVYVIAEQSNGWSKVEIRDNVGYVKSEYLSDKIISYANHSNYVDYSLSQYGYDSSFKSYMPYSAITNRSSKQWSLQQQAVTASNGLRTIGGRICVAIGTYFNAEVGTKIDLLMENGATIQAIVADIKDDRHTDSRNIQTFDGSCVEVLVHISSLPSMVRKMGNVSYISDDWKGNIKTIRVYK